MPKTSSERPSAPPTRIHLHGPAMGTQWSVRCDIAPDADTEALRSRLAAAVEEVDRQMSPWKPDSDLTRLNQAPPEQWLPLPEQTLEVLGRALEIARQSEGAFDPAVGALVDAWGFGAARDTPDPVAIRAAARTPWRPAYQWLELDRAGGRVCKRAPLALDLCAIAKGYAVDRMATVLKRNGVAHALVALDGELRACGAQAGGEPWPVALESPQPGCRAVHGVLELRDLSVATSGDYRRFVKVGNVRLAHSMDGRRAAPVNNDVASVTVLAADCTSADAWATALLVAGPDKGLPLAQRMGLDVLYLLRREGHWIERGRGRFAAAVGSDAR
ncbi:MAG: FAD:protein FMN transferase [Burkholderiales bacterium]|nr:FAD:protein FMN transferase [Burkholderiales bacterium]